MHARFCISLFLRTAPESSLTSSITAPAESRAIAKLITSNRDLCCTTINSWKDSAKVAWQVVWKARHVDLGHYSSLSEIPEATEYGGQ